MLADEAETTHVQLVAQATPQHSAQARLYGHCMQSLQCVPALTSRSAQTCRGPCQSLLHTSQIIAYILSTTGNCCISCNTAPMHTSTGFSLCTSYVSNHALIVQGMAVSAVIWLPCSTGISSFACMCQIMLWLCRGSLYQLLHSPSAYLNWHQLVGMCLATAQGMLHLHSHQALHRDLKSGVGRRLHICNHAYMLL